MARRFLSTCLLSARLAAALLAKDDSCDCYKTSTSQIFMNRALFDFRELAQYAGRPALTDNADAASGALATSDYFLSDEWRSAWATQTWSREATDNTILMVNSPNNLFIDGSALGTYLVMRTARDQNGLQTAAEFQSNMDNFQFMSARMYARTVGSAGACTAMFTYLNSNPVQEADIEFLTKDSGNVVHYTNQPVTDANEPDATRVVTMPVGRGDWAEHRLDWTDGLSQWFVNGASQAEISFQAPTDPTRLVFNSWSNGGSWTGLMDKGGEASLEIQWIDVAYNVSTTAKGATCTKVCELDNSAYTSKCKA